MALQKGDVAAALEIAGLEGNVRAEKLSMEELAALCEACQAKKEQIWASRRYVKGALQNTHFGNLP